MPVQFSGSLNPGQYQVWSTWGWPRERFVEWSVRPSPGQVGQVSLRALAVEAAQDGTLTYWLTVWNIGRSPVTFDALYTATTTYQSIFDDSGTYSLGAGQTVNLTWDFGMPPTLLTLMPIPITFIGAVIPNVVFGCSAPTVQLNTNGTATYAFSVTNSGSNSTGIFRMRAALT